MRSLWEQLRYSYYYGMIASISIRSQGTVFGGRHLRCKWWMTIYGPLPMHKKLWKYHDKVFSIACVLHRVFGLTFSNQRTNHFWKQHIYGTLKGFCHSWNRTLSALATLLCLRRCNSALEHTTSLIFATRLFTTVFVDTWLLKTKPPRKRFQNFPQSYVLSTDRIKIHQSQPTSMT